jgi:hypothetical protein
MLDEVAAVRPVHELRVFAHSDLEESSTVNLPRDDKPVQFEVHIKPLLREKDRQSMRLHFDLCSYQEVSDHADASSSGCGAAPCLVTARGRLNKSRSSNAGLAAGSCSDQLSRLGL